MCMMLRTNIEIDEELVSAVMRRYDLKTKKDAVDLSLRKAVGGPLTSEFLDEVEGMGWGGDLAEIRNDRPTEF